ncbi:MAG: signal peptidase I [Candidatus Omnitrophota bacterium]
MSAGLRVFIFIIFAVVISAVIRTYYFQSFRITAGAMAPTLVEGDRVLVNKSIYKHADPQRWDVVAYVGPDNLSKIHLHRIVGLPGETLEIREGGVLINGQIVAMPLGFKYSNQGEFVKAGGQVRIPENNYFLLGDHTATSKDSRYVGFLDRKMIVGKVERIYYPFGRAGLIKS